MKNLVRALCAALAALLLVLGFVACDGGHTHAYTIKNVDDAYVKNPATTSSPAEYYYSCSCGEKGTETFTFGFPLPGGSEDEGNTPGGAVDSLDPGLIFTKNSDNTTYTLSTYNGSASHVTIPSTYKGGKVTAIGNSAFSNCYALTSVTIPNSIVSIDSFAFENCNSLAEVNIPNGVRLIGWSAFENCSALTKITVADSVTSIDYNAFSGCANVREIEGAAFVFQHIPCEKLKKATITSGDISVEAFKGYSGLTSITIPNSVTSIGNYAFYGCWNLKYNEYGNAYYLGNSTNPYVYLEEAKNTTITSVTIPDGVKVIGDSAFQRCSGLKSVTIPNSVTSIGDSAFQRCSGLTSITIPNSVTSIGPSAFRDCSGLTSVTIGNGVTSIGGSAFKGCSSLTSITIPDSVTSIGPSAFRDCSRLTSITLPFVGASKDGTSNTHFGYIFGAVPYSLKTVVITGGTSIGPSAFLGCSDLTSVTIGNGVTSIGPSAFLGCSNLTSVTIGNGVTSIEGSAFSGCTGLTSIKYRGSQSDWNKICKGTDWNFGTGNITITYNYTGK